MNALAKVRALHVLSAARITAAELEPVSSVTNEVWLTEKHVVRINRKSTGRLRREALLAPQLPPATGYPGILAAGNGPQMDWLVVHRRPGSTLARRRCVHQLAQRLRAVHTTSTPPELADIVAPQLVAAGVAHPLGPVERAIDAARTLAGVPATLLDALASRVRTLGPALGGFEATTLIHGDLTFENVLVDAGDITAIIDFEWCRGAPADVDLDIILRMCAYPALHVPDDCSADARAEDFLAVPEWLYEAYPELFSHPALPERLELYSLAFDLHELLRFPPSGSTAQLPPLHAMNRLAATLDGRGHLTRWLARR
jgi:hygromycin-B 7''-O-kinase